MLDFYIQTIPQLVLQIWYLLQTADLSDDNAPIAIAAAVFSGLQIIATISAAHTQCILSKYQQSVMFEFKVLGLGKKHRKLQTQTKDIAKDIAHMLGVHGDVVHIEKPEAFHLKIHLYPNDPDLNGPIYKDLLRNAVRDGTMGEIIMKNWKLSEMPVIRDLELAPHFLLNREDDLVPKKGENGSSQMKSPSLLAVPPVQESVGDIDEEKVTRQDICDKHVCPKKIICSQDLSDLVLGQQRNTFVLEPMPNVFGWTFDIVGEQPEGVDIPIYHQFHRETDTEFAYLQEPYVRFIDDDCCSNRENDA